MLGGNVNVTARIVGLHPVDAPEPCHLCEVVIESEANEVDFGAFTQALADRDRSYWQVPYNERLLSSSEGRRTYAFFFHYLDLDQPMQSPFGPLPLPRPTPRPQRLAFIAYEAP